MTLSIIFCTIHLFDYALNFIDTIRISMGTSCAFFIAKLFLLCYESDSAMDWSGVCDFLAFPDYTHLLFYAVSF